MLFSKDRGLTERATSEQRREGDTRASVLAEGTASAKALREQQEEEQEEARVAGVQPAAAEKPEIRPGNWGGGRAAGWGVTGTADTAHHSVPRL